MTVPDFFMSNKFEYLDSTIFYELHMRYSTTWIV